MGRFIIPAITLVVLVIEAVLTTLVLMVVLNGYPSLPDAIMFIYLACSCGLLPALSLLVGFSAQKISEISPIPAWAAGIGLVIVALVVLPVILFGLTFTLLGIFGML
jgi:hypothetical protein